MFNIQITLKSFEYYYIEKNTLFLKKILYLLNKFVSKYNILTKEKKIKKTLQKRNLPLQNKMQTQKKIKKKKEKKYNKKKVLMINLPKKIKLFTVNSGPHIHKKSRTQFYFTVYTKKLYINIKHIKNFIVFLFLLKNSNFFGTEIYICVNVNSVFSRKMFLLKKKQTQKQK